ncbi:error-prone DNA polymerase, partial [Caballeronia sp. LZ035]|nr:error-prone DNA polymerase [Caballeronia sp. LZ035]
EKYYDRIVNGMQQRGYDKAFAEAIFEQIKGFGEYGFPESHAASFALLVYTSSWLKRHEPAAFLTAMLNSQPMGFYSPSQLVQDAQRHDVKVVPIDVTISGWDSVLERQAGCQAPVVRLGLSLLKGMRDGAAQRIENARAVRPFGSVSDLARRAQLDRHDLQVLAAANALHSLAGNRRDALWQSAAAVPDRDLLADSRIDDETPALGAPSEAQ